MIVPLFHNISRPAIPFGCILEIAHLKRKFVSLFRSLEVQGIQPFTLRFLKTRLKIAVLTVQLSPSPYLSSKSYNLLQNVQQKYTGI